MHFVEVGACQGLKPKAHPKHLRGAEAPLFHGKTALVAFFSNLLKHDIPALKAAAEAGKPCYSGDASIRLLTVTRLPPVTSGNK
jgi:hypothetical protein